MFRKLITAICLLSLLVACGKNNTESTQSNDVEQKAGKQDKPEEVSITDVFGSNVSIKQENNTVLFDIILKNKADEKKEFTVPSGQKFEIVVTNENGDEVYRYSKDKMFTMAIETEEIGVGEEVTYHDEWKLEGNLKGGMYDAKVTFMISKVDGKEVSAKPLSVTKNFELEAVNQAFRNIEVSGENGRYTVTGEARVFEGRFFYAIEEGHEYIVEEKSVSVEKGAPNWSPFEIKVSIPTDKLPVNGTLTMELYERSAKDNSMKNMYLVKLEEIKKEIE